MSHLKNKPKTFWGEMLQSLFSRHTWYIHGTEIEFNLMHVQVRGWAGILQFQGKIIHAYNFFSKPMQTMLRKFNRST